MHCFTRFLGLGVPLLATTLASLASAAGVDAAEASLRQARHAATVATETQLIHACQNPGVDLVYCPSPIDVTQEIDLGNKDIVAGPRAFVFGANGRLVNGRSVSRLASNARYPVFMGARVGRWVWYTGRVTYKGTNYAPRTDGPIPPGVFGSWNDSVRDVTLWSQFHEGKHNDAIEAAQNSLPGKGKLCDRVGTIKLPGGTITLVRAIYYTVGMQIRGHEGLNRAHTTLSVSESFKAPDRLYDLPDDFAIIGVPQNRNKPSRVTVAGGGGDGKSVFWSSLRNLYVETHGRCNGVLLHASMASEIRNVELRGARGYRGWVIRGSDDFKMLNTGAAGFDVGYDFLGSCINVDVDSTRLGGCAIGYRIQGPVKPAGRLASIRINNANIEGCHLPFDIHRPRGILITSFTAQSAKEKAPAGKGYPLAVIDVAGAHEWPNYDLVLRGATTKGFDRIHVVMGDKTDVWRLATRRIDNSGFAYDLSRYGPSGKGTAWTGVDFNLNHEFGPNAQKFRNEPATPTNIPILR